VGPLHYRLIEGYSKSQVEKGGEKTSGAWVVQQSPGTGPASSESTEQNRSFLSGVLHESFQLAEKQLVITKGDDVLSKPLLLDTSALAPCNHKEANSRIMLHAAHTAHNGHKNPHLHR